MISDVLANAVYELDQYLHDPTWGRTYAGTMRLKLAELRDQMDAMRVKLDTPPER